MSVFGSADLDLFIADMGVDCAGPAGPFRALFDRADEIIDVGSAGEISADYVLTARTDALQIAGVTSTSRDYGIPVTVDGTGYRVRQVRAIDDGAFSYVDLEVPG